MRDTTATDPSTDFETVTVEASAVPTECTAPDCEATPRFAWRDRDGDLRSDPVAGILKPWLCGACRERVPGRGFSRGE